MLESFVNEERRHCDWPIKWKAFEDLGLFERDAILGERRKSEMDLPPNTALEPAAARFSVAERRVRS